MAATTNASFLAGGEDLASLSVPQVLLIAGGPIALAAVGASVVVFMSNRTQGHEQALLRASGATDAAVLGSALLQASPAPLLSPVWCSRSSPPRCPWRRACANRSPPAWLWHDRHAAVRERTGLRTRVTRVQVVRLLSSPGIGTERRPRRRSDRVADYRLRSRYGRRMTGMPHTDADTEASARPRHRLDVLGIVAVSLGIIGLLPSLVIFLVGLLPEMQMIYWLLIVTIPILGIGGVIAVILGVVGIIVGVRRQTRYIWSIAGIALGILMLAPVGLLYIGQ